MQIVAMANYIIALAVILAFSTIIEVKGQSTAQVCENGDSLNSIAAELSLEVIHQLNIQLQSIREILTELQQGRKSQQDIVLIGLQAVDRRSQNQIENIHQFLNASLVEMKNQQDTLMTSLQYQSMPIQALFNISFQQMVTHHDIIIARLQAVDRRSLEQDISIRKVQSSNEFLNVSLQQMKNQLNTAVTSLQTDDRRSQNQIETIYRFLNVSFQQMKGQQDSVLRKLEALEHDHSVIKNQTQKNSWKLEIALVSDVGEVPVLPPTVNDWIVLMHRFNGSLNFNRNWDEYKNGFGDMRRGEFWLGNEKIHRLTIRFNYTLRIEMYINGTWFYAEYTNFSIDSESNKYTLRLSGYSGNAGDSLTNISIGSHWFHGGMSFTTRDFDNDRWSGGNCALGFGGGWWFNDCTLACLTCSYNGFFRWYTLGHLESSSRLRAARMMIKSK